MVGDANSLKFTHKQSPEFPHIPRKNIGGKRYYEAPNGMLLNSVTRVIGILDKEGIDAWRARVGDGYADAVSQRATTLGTKMHKVIECYLDNKTITEKNIIALAHFKNIKPFLDKINNIYKLEAHLYSESLGLAGTVDCVAEYEGVKSIIDFKTSSKKKEEQWIEKYFLQETAYALMWNDLTELPVDQIVTIISCEDGSRDVFIKSKDTYINRLLEVIKQFNKVV